MSVLTPNEPYIPPFLDQQKERLLLVHAQMRGLAPADVPVALNTYASRDSSRMARYHVLHGESDELIVNILPFGNGVNGRGELAPHMALRSLAMQRVTGASVVTIPHYSDQPAMLFTGDDKHKMLDGNVQPFADYVEAILEDTAGPAPTRRVITGYSLGAVLGAKLLESDHLAPDAFFGVEPTNINQLSAVSLLSRYARIGSRAVKEAAAHSAVPVLDESLRSALAPSTLVAGFAHNTYFRNVLRDGQYAADIARGSTPAWTVGFSDSGMCSPNDIAKLQSQEQAAESLTYGYPGIELGHVTPDNIWVHAGLLARFGS